MTADEIRDLLQLVPLPGEGGYYRETYRANAQLPGSTKSLSTAIYYFLTPDTCSLLHRLPTDEVYHFYLGSPVHLVLLPPGEKGEVVTLGTDLYAGYRPQVVVPAGTWQGSRLALDGDYALLGTTMSPGFDFSDYEAGQRSQLKSDFADYADWITRLTLPD